MMCCRSSRVRRPGVSGKVLLRPRYCPNPPLSGTGEKNGGMFHCEGFVLVDGPRLDQPLTALLKQVLLISWVQVVHLDRQLPAHVVQQHPPDLLPYLRAGELQGWMAISP